MPTTQPTDRGRRRRFKAQRPESYTSLMFKVRSALGLSLKELAARIGWAKYQDVSEHERLHKLPSNFDKRQRFNELAREAVTLLEDRYTALVGQGLRDDANTRLYDEQQK